MIIPPEIFMLKEPTDDELAKYNSIEFDDEELYSIQTEFHSLSVVKNSIGKFLMYNETYQAGIIDHPLYNGNLPYINYFLLPYLINPQIKNILLVGLGSGRIIMDWLALSPKLKSIDIVDIDSKVIDIARNYFDFTPNSKVKMHLQDGRVFIRSKKEKYDLIIIDVASDEGLPYRFMTEEFLREAKSALKSDGILVSNMFASADFKNPKNVMLQSFYATFKAVFGKVGVFKGDYSDEIYYKVFIDSDKRIIDITNTIFFASDAFDYANIEEIALKNKKIFEKIGLKNIEKYAQDLYLEQICTTKYKVLKDVYLENVDFSLDNFEQFLLKA